MGWLDEKSQLGSVTSWIPNAAAAGPLGLFPTNQTYLDSIGAGNQATAVGGSVGQTEPGPIELQPKPAAAASTAQTKPALDPWIAYLINKEMAARQFALDATRNKVNAGLATSEAQQGVDVAALTEKYNRDSGTAATPFVSRGLGTSGITQTGIARFHTDYANAKIQLNETYRQARAVLLQQLADAETQAGTSDLDTLLKALEATNPSTSG